jgi:hypothetical protein
MGPRTQIISFRAAALDTYQFSLLGVMWARIESDAVLLDDASDATH